MDMVVRGGDRSRTRICIITAANRTSSGTDVIFRYLETGLSYAADGAWQLFEAMKSPSVGNSFPPCTLAISPGFPNASSGRRALASQQFMGPRMPGVSPAA